MYGVTQLEQIHKLQNKQAQKRPPMEAHGMFTARQDASVSRCTVHELNAAVHATGRNSFSNEHSGLTHLLFTVHLIALSFFEIAQMKYRKNNPEKKV